MSARLKVGGADRAQEFIEMKCNSTLANPAYGVNIMYFYNQDMLIGGFQFGSNNDNDNAKFYLFGNTLGAVIEADLQIAFPTLKLVPTTINGALRVSGAGDLRVDNLGGTGNRTVYSTSDGTLTNTSSDITMKTNIVTLPDCLDKTTKLNPVSFNWNENYSSNLGQQKEIGFVAQEVQKIIPEVVGINNDGTLSLDYAKMVPVLTGAIQELRKEVDELKNLMQSWKMKLYEIGNC